jgi:hypothetical protein
MRVGANAGVGMLGSFVVVPGRFGVGVGGHWLGDRFYTIEFTLPRVCQPLIDPRHAVFRRQHPDQQQ